MGSNANACVCFFQLLCRPADPLRMLGEFLLQRSTQIEGGGGTGPSAATPVAAAAAAEDKGEDMNGVEQ